MKLAPSLKESSDPGILFLGLWRLMASADVNHASRAPSCSRELEGKFCATLSVDDPVVAVQRIWALLTEAWPSGLNAKMLQEQIAVLLGAMRAIDDLFLHVHPRSRLLAPDIPMAKVPGWLEDLAEHRSISGAYAFADGLRLITRGPLSRQPIDLAEIAGYSLPEQFSALQVVPATVRHGERDLPVVMKVVDQTLARGVPPSSVGAERIIFLPVADGRDELVADIIQREEIEYLNVRPGEALRPVEKVLSTVDACHDADVLLLPELVFEPDHVAALSTALDGRAAPRIIVAGSGFVDHEEAGNPGYNAGTVLNGLGRPLWSYQKVWAYWMLEHSADQLDLGTRACAGHLREDIAMGSELRMVDIDSFGRCIVLICQDFQMQLAVENVLKTYQPDWVFVPILDTGTGYDRWPRVRASALAGHSQARFLVVSSLTMTHWLRNPQDEPAIGLAIGPDHVARANEDDQDRAMQAIRCISADERYGLVEWRSADGWETSKFNIPV